MARWKTLRDEVLTESWVVDVDERGGKQRPDVQIDDGRASVGPWKIGAPVEHKLSPRVGIIGILGEEPSDLFQERQVSQEERVIRWNGLDLVSILLVMS